LVHVERHTHVYPVYRVGFEQPRQLVEEHLDTRPNVAVVGRQARFAHDNTHHALLMGRAAAWSLRDDGAVDGPAWRAVRATFADHVVED
jgi:protoporphyrinogen oxidase